MRFKKVFRKTMLKIILVIKSLKDNIGIMLAQRHRRWPSIKSALGQYVSYYLGSGFWRREDESVIRIGMPQLHSANTGQLPNAVSMSGQRRRHWAIIKTALGKWNIFLGRAAAKCTADPVSQH